MDSLWEAIEKWLKDLLIDGITGNLSGMFDNVNMQVGKIAGDVGMTPSAWNGDIFSMVRSLSETVIIPIAGIILTFVMCYELIQMVIEKNNMHEIDTWIFFKWIFKTFVAVYLITNTFNIVMAIFDMSQHVVSGAAGVIITDTNIDITSVVADMMTTSLAPIPFATMANREWGGMGQNYLKSMLALGFQAFLIMVCVGIYAVLVQSIATDEDIITAIWTCMGYTILLCFTLFKTGSLAKSIFSAH